MDHLKTNESSLNDLDSHFFLLNKNGHLKRANISIRSRGIKKAQWTTWYIGFW